MKEKTKPKYSITQNIVWMVKIAWKTRKRVLLFCVLTAALEILYSLAQLYIAPEILRRVENHAAIGSLLGTILLFTVFLFLTLSVKDYIKENTLFPRVDVRTEIIGMIGFKCNTTSYPNTLDADFIKLREKAHLACESNREATELIWQTLTLLLQNAGGFLIYLTILSHLDWMMLAAVIATCIIGFLVSRYTNNWMFTHREAEDVYYAKKRYIRGKAESVELAKDIRIFGLQDWMNELLENVHDVYLDFRLKVERMRFLADITEAVLTAARNGIAYVYLIHMALEDGLGVPEFLLYFTAVTGFTDWVMGILQQAVKLHKQSLDISCVREFLEYPEPFRFEEGEAIPAADGYERKLESDASQSNAAETKQSAMACELRPESVPQPNTAETEQSVMACELRPEDVSQPNAAETEQSAMMCELRPENTSLPNAAETKQRPMAYELKLENVSFRYPGAREDTIHDLNLTVHPGEKLAVVGLNGAGKTTLVRLLCGLFDPTKGRVLLNGRDIRDFNRWEYYGLFGAVFQEFSILDVTVAENIAQTNQQIDYDRIRDCVEKAGLTKTIAGMPQGLDTHVGREVYLDGVLFSGGQTQRLMLARALYKDAPILMLDEPTAALDPIAENDIYLKYNSMTAGRTSVFISHRLASTRFCDRIIFVSDGRIAEEGTHESLLAMGGEYAKLFEIQSRYYQEGKEF